MELKVNEALEKFSFETKNRLAAVEDGVGKMFDKSGVSNHLVEMVAAEVERHAQSFKA